MKERTFGEKVRALEGAGAVRFRYTEEIKRGPWICYYEDIFMPQDGRFLPVCGVGATPEEAVDGLWRGLELRGHMSLAAPDGKTISVAWMGEEWGAFARDDGS